MILAAPGVAREIRRRRHLRAGTPVPLWRELEDVATRPRAGRSGHRHAARVRRTAGRPSRGRSRDARAPPAPGRARAFRANVRARTRRRRRPRREGADRCPAGRQPACGSMASAVAPALSGAAPACQPRGRRRARARLSVEFAGIPPSDGKSGLQSHQPLLSLQTHLPRGAPCARSRAQASPSSLRRRCWPGLRPPPSAPTGPPPPRRVSRSPPPRPTSVTMTWTPVSRAERYRLQISSSATMENPTYQRSTDTTDVVEGLEPGRVLLRQGPRHHRRWCEPQRVLGRGEGLDVVLGAHRAQVDGAGRDVGDVRLGGGAERAEVPDPDRRRRVLDGLDLSPLHALRRHGHRAVRSEDVLRAGPRHHPRRTEPEQLLADGHRQAGRREGGGEEAPPSTGSKPLTIASYNVRCANCYSRQNLERPWSERRGVVVAAILKQKPDVIGVQEASQGWIVVERPEDRASPSSRTCGTGCVPAGRRTRSPTRTATTA